MQFISEQASGNTGNGGATFKGRAGSSASALRRAEEPESWQQLTSFLRAQPGSPPARTFQPGNRTASASVTHEKAQTFWSSLLQ